MNPCQAPCDNMNWRQMGECINGDDNFTILQPVSLSHSGNRVVIGTADWGAKGPTTVKVFDFDGVQWNEAGRFSGRKEDLFGESIALSGDGKRLAIGGRLSCEGGKRSGHVELYEQKEGAVWELLGQKIIGLQPFDEFGFLVSMSKDGNRISVKSKRHLRVFEFDRDVNRKIVQAIAGEADWCADILEFLGENWIQIGESIEAGVEDTTVLSENGNVVAIGNKFDSDIGIASGSVHALKYSSKRNATEKKKVAQRTKSMQGKGNWLQIGQKLHGKAAEDWFGTSLSTNAQGDALAVIAPTLNNGSGYVKAFQLNNNNWNPMGEIITDEKKCFFGESICLAPNANKIAVGAQFENGGCVIIFNYNGNEWVPEVNLSPPTSEPSYGHSVSFSSCGNRLAIGSTVQYGIKRRGCVRIYEFV